MTSNTAVVGAPAVAEAVCDLPVQGMTCASCVRHVERALRKVPGVGDAAVNLATQRATVHYDPSRAEPSALVRAVEDAGYQVPSFPVRPKGAETEGPTAEERADALAQAEAREQHGLRRDLTIAAVLTIPLLILAMSHGALPGSEGELGRLIQLVLATPVMFGPGMRFVRLALKALKQRTADMNTLVSLGALASYGYSTAAVVAPRLFAGGAHHGPPLYFEAGAAIIMFVLLGKLLEARARKRLSDAVRGLGSLLPPHATRLVGERQEQVTLSALLPGDLVLVRPGERVPSDGRVVRGASAIDESMLTGESVPVDKAEGNPVYGGTLNQSGALTVRVTGVGADTALARIVEAVEQAQGSRAPIAQLADRVSAYFVPIVLGVGLVTLAVWVALDPTTAGLSIAIERFVAVLVIACPCALGLATPAAVAVGTGRGAELGILIKGGAALEAASRIDSVLFDKTGTLTEGKPQLTDVIARGVPESELLALVAAVEQSSEHPLARAIVEGARTRGAVMGASEGFVSAAGLGAEARVAGRRVRVGTAAWLERAGVASDDLADEAARLAALGRTPSFVAIDGALAGLLGVADRPAESAKATLEALARDGISVAMITGDQRATARAVARELGIERVFAEARPEDKARIVAEERAAGRTVAMVGDGVNDAPALAAAHVGIAIGSGTDIAVAAADLALMHGGIARLPSALALARATLRTIRQNLFWAFVYNLVGIPLAAGLLYPFTGFQLSPVFASAAMSLSSVSVLANSLRLRRFHD